MSIFVAIIGLAFLILVHEAGHFFTARAVGMRPRRFYLGFPPAIAKTTRNGIEYGIGAIPLGGYVKIPGMHRPAPGDVDVHFGRALQKSPELVGPVQRLKRALPTATRVPRGRPWPSSSSCGAGSGRGRSSAGLREIDDGLADDAYWRQRTWKRVAVIVAGPATNLVLAVVLFACLFLVGGGKATNTVGQVLPNTPAAAVGLQPGDVILAVNVVAVTPPDIPARISGSRWSPVTLLVQRGERRSRSGQFDPQQDRGRVLARIHAQGRGPRRRRVGLAVGAADRRRHERDRQVARPARPRRGPEGHLQPGRDRADARPERQARHRRTTCGFSA